MLIEEEENQYEVQSSLLNHTKSGVSGTTLDSHVKI